MEVELKDILGNTPMVMEVAHDLRGASGPVFSRRGYLLFCNTARSEIWQWQDGKARGQKNEEMALRREMLQTDRKRNQEKQPVDHDAPALDARGERNNCPAKNQTMG